MTASIEADGRSTAVEDASVLADPVLSTLREAEAEYLEVRSDWMRHQAELRLARAELDQTRQSEQRLGAEVQRLQEELMKERQRLSRAKARARRLADSLKDIHRALFTGNVYDLILKACMTLTGSTRGLYLTSWGEGKLRVRSAVDVADYPQAPPSPFIRALCQKVMDGKESFVCNDPSSFAGLPEAGRPDEEFRNCMAAPAVLLKQFNGVLVLADKVDGPYEQEDVDLVVSVGDQAGVALENKRLQDELLAAYFGVVGVLADAVEAKDPYTHGHCEMVARYGRRTAERLGLSDGDRSVVCFGGLLHDVGKIGVSDGVLNKMGKLLPEEWDLMRSHVRVGRDLLSRVPALERVADVVLHHHERFDGKGYPEGLSGEQISLASRIICVVDAYSAMIAKRSYKESMSDADARAELLRCKGSHFDPEVVDAFLTVLDQPAETDDCPDGCGLPPQFYHPMELERALQGTVAARQAVKRTDGSE